jgi:hypothetical protein
VDYVAAVGLLDEGSGEEKPSEGKDSK